MRTGRGGLVPVGATTSTSPGAPVRNTVATCSSVSFIAPAEISPAARLRIGALAGRLTLTHQGDDGLVLSVPRPTSAGTRPALTIDDLPQPDSPRTDTSREIPSRRSMVSILSSCPKNR